jgi:hypothetical protein
MPSTPKELLAQSRGADPMDCPWGLYVLPASGEGESLLWFADAAQLQGFVVEALWPALLEVDAAPDTTAELRALFAGAPALSWGLLDAANQLLEPAGQIHWWGRLRQLFEGQDPFARDLREAWRQDAGVGIQDFSALRPEQQREFAGFLRTLFP